MNREEAEQIVDGYTAQCESGMRDWGWIDSADGPCRSFLFFHPDYYTPPLEVTSCFGMADIVTEGDPLASYINFVTNAIERPSEADETINTLKKRLLTEGSPLVQMKAVNILMGDSEACPALDDVDKYMRSLLVAAANSGNEDAAKVISDKGWEGLCELEFERLKLESESERVNEMYEEAGRLREKGGHEEAEDLYRQVLADREMILGWKHADTFDCVFKLACVLRNKGDNDGAEDLYRRARSGMGPRWFWFKIGSDGILGSEFGGSPSLIQDGGMKLVAKGDNDGAEDLYRRALAGYEKVLGPEHKDILDCVASLGEVLRRKGDNDGAEESYRRALAGREKIDGPMNRGTLDCVHNLGDLLSDKGDSEGAEKLYRRALEGREKTLGPNHPSTLHSVNNLGYLLRDKGDLEGAEELYRKAAEQGDADAQRELGVMYALGKGVTQDEVEALKWFRKAVEQGDAISQDNLALMYMNGEGVTQDFSEAEKLFRKAAEQGYAQAQYHLGVVYYGNDCGFTEDHAEAEMWFRKAAEQGDNEAQELLDRLKEK